jgi:hypothetical protein
MGEAVATRIHNHREMLSPVIARSESDEAIHAFGLLRYGLLRFARNDEMIDRSKLHTPVVLGPGFRQADEAGAHALRNACSMARWLAVVL